MTKTSTKTSVRQKFSKAHKIGLSPGSLVFVGNKKTEIPRISVFSYGPQFCREFSLTEISGLKSTTAGLPETVNWINIDGLHDTDLIEEIGGLFRIHPLTLEDLLNTVSRPKIDDYDSYLFVSMKMLDYDESQKRINSEQVSLILTTDTVLSFQEHPGDLFEPLRERIRTGKGRVRKMGSSYLAFSLIDIVMDYYFVILELLEDRIDHLEPRLIDSPGTEVLADIYQLKKEMLFLKKSIWPLREVASQLQRSESELIEEKSRPYFRDLYDHGIQVIDVIESNRELLGGMLDLYLSSNGNRMNEVMKVLTIIATIFIPLTFIAGIYGMNFEYMPELSWEYGYFGVWGVMVLVAAVMILYFRRRKWL